MGHSNLCSLLTHKITRSGSRTSTFGYVSVVVGVGILRHLQNTRVSCKKSVSFTRNKVTSVAATIIVCCPRACSTETLHYGQIGKTEMCVSPCKFTDLAVRRPPRQRPGLLASECGLSFSVFPPSLFILASPSSMCSFVNCKNCE